MRCTLMVISRFYTCRQEVMWSCDRRTCGHYSQSQTPPLVKVQTGDGEDGGVQQTHADT